VGAHGDVIAANDGRTSAAQAIDPVCGMTVDPGTASHADHDGHRYFFCSAGCRDRFQADPEPYAAVPPTPPTHHER